MNKLEISNMIWLALEFSSERRSVAVAIGETIRAEVVHQGTTRTPIFELIQDALREAGIERRHVEGLAVGLGPGSYTGVRLAISVAQGWQLATQVRVQGINSLENLAVWAGTDPRPRLLAVDAQRGEFAVAQAEGGRLVGPMQLLPLDELRRQHESGTRIGGPEIARSIPGALEIFPSATVLAQMAQASSEGVLAESLAPVYLRAVNFVKAPPPRELFLR